MNRTIQYIILERDYALVKFYNVGKEMVFLKSILRIKIKNQYTNFLLTKSDSISNYEFENYIDSLKEYCLIGEKKEGSVILRANNPF